MPDEITIRFVRCITTYIDRSNDFWLPAKKAKQLAKQGELIPVVAPKDCDEVLCLHDFADRYLALGTRIYKGDIKLAVRRKSSTNEWVVRFYLNGKHIEENDSYQSTKQDAIGTMHHIARSLEK